jgi:hypothetical protein
MVVVSEESGEEERERYSSLETGKVSELRR